MWLITLARVLRSSCASVQAAPQDKISQNTSTTLIAAQAGLEDHKVTLHPGYPVVRGRLFTVFNS